MEDFREWQQFASCPNGVYSPHNRKLHSYKWLNLMTANWTQNKNLSSTSISTYKNKYLLLTPLWHKCQSLEGQCEGGQRESEDRGDRRGRMWVWNSLISRAKHVSPVHPVSASNESLWRKSILWTRTPPCKRLTNYIYSTRLRAFFLRPAPWAWATAWMQQRGYISRRPELSFNVAE